MITSVVFSLAVYLAITAVYSLVGALLLTAFTRMVADIDLRYGAAYFVSFMGLVVTSVVHVFIRLGTPPAMAVHPAVEVVVSCLVSIFISGLVFGSMIKSRRSREPVGFFKGVLIALPYYVVLMFVVAPLIILAVGVELIGG